MNKKINWGYTKKIIFEGIFSFFLLIYFPFDFNFDLHKLFGVLLITFISDNINVKWRNEKRLVSNIPGFLIAFLLGPQYILYSAAITILRIDNKVSLIQRIRKFFVYFIMYYGSYIIVEKLEFNLNIYFELFLFVTIAKILNTIFVDIKNFKLNMFFIEYIFFIATLPSIYLYLISRNLLVRHYFLLQNLLFLGIYFFITKYLYEKEEERVKNKRLKKFNEIMLEFSNLLHAYSIKAPKEVILREVAKLLNEKFQYKYVLISEIDYQNDEIKRVVYAGFSKEDFEKLRKRKVRASEIIENVFKNEYRYGEVYFIPNFAENINENNYFIFEQNITANIYDKDYLWNEKDLLALTLRNKNDEIIGYISCDTPEDGLRPTTEDMQTLSVLAKIVSMILIHGNYFTEIKKLSEIDHLTGLYNSSKLRKDLEIYEKREKLIALAFIDLDNFKYINDKYGHLKGDMILKEISDIIKVSIREKDKAYRYGGDEFVIIFEDVDKFTARNILKRIRKKLLKVHVKFSVGIEDNKKTSILKLIKAADKKAYRAKNKGKNKIIC
ncbi:MULTISPECIES: sensor domain-containing diguanylate cyclase [unclassified Marinitoga]|uniref:sensor domain-containing diguanylate cyclase n=1 Tax=unclassified Marinitoga TaxID=2640159 RepID=UPI0006411276|nr:MULTISPECIES: GGDEF domain-containing protein [unclassified Marinitoga]KLO22367.1 hypothetical protein X274_08385 [Marinitoga sp. 1155]NUU99541.1 hypothetical protein [Marinitoga sp. 1154]